MTKVNWMVVLVCAMLLCSGRTVAATSAQQNCDNARVGARKNYEACVDGLVAKDAKGTYFDRYAGFAKCRHKYFRTWAALQSYTGSTCVGERFTDNLDQTVTDNLTELTWEKKDNGGGVHDKDNFYAYSTASYKEDGTAFATFLTDSLTGLNVVGFGGANGWRLPTLAELQTIVLDFECKGVGFSPACVCPSSPCIEPALDAANTP